ncbi:RING finger protein 37 [Coemansia sp. RSA 1813]|nr:RING finger protein 37 [Coemansia sp. RSA 1646]KAJ1772581.1 RING finger protein 37 [Coemansia sp. RSA 1843]KAJ2091436.1 RING finger protein 37 [Coemansia sp. RSA 986]KAJ2213899.1 RING finger protein 37 [Coemansia sp. RSA 487]KAJ2569601.1 RING finger protein 37 [Coemansia sp. RSA 1813]
MELFDYADLRLGTAASSTCPCTTNYEISNLLKKRSHTAGDQQLPLLLGMQHLGGSSGGFMAESFVRPPVDIVFTLPYQVSLASIVINPCIRRGHAKVANVFTMGVNRDRWEFAGKLVWESNAEGMHQQQQRYGLHNGDVTPEMLSQAMKTADRNHCSRSTRWSVMRAPSANALHFIKQIKITIVAMHEVHAVGVGGIEIWAQPSQRLPGDQKVRAWMEAYQAIAQPVADASGQPLPHIMARHGTSSISAFDCPQEFIDTITQNIMTDPVVLPSGARCDRSTIARHLDSHRTDPFTGLPLDQSQIEPDLALKLRIQSWVDNSYKK